MRTLTPTMLFTTFMIRPQLEPAAAAAAAMIRGGSVPVARGPAGSHHHPRPQATPQPPVPAITVTKPDPPPAPAPATAALPGSAAPLALPGSHTAG